MITHPNVKINLGLNVLRRREDGYHDIETLFVPYMGITDTLEIITGDEFSETSSALFERYPSEGQISQDISPDGKLMITIAKQDGVDWNPLKDLTAKAYFLLAEDFPDLPPVKIYLEKTAPVGAGLGGGSSDASFALTMLNEICRLGLNQSQLASYAARLGSDCAFFIFNTPMFGEGRGEILTQHPVPELDNFEIRIKFRPGTSVSTAQAYHSLKPHPAAISLRSALTLPVAEWKNCVFNDFEESVFALQPVLKKLKQELYDEGAVYASMSGSGSAIFGLFYKSKN
ncbi:MAG: 4-(cytidine 5'-diphospho)-2-C-methyl-D-erythritol kinase [Candidatus Cryptobacteroides sp.]